LATASETPRIALLARLEADEFGADGVQNRVDGLEHTLAPVAVTTVA